MRKKDNQFKCSSIILPEHREELARAQQQEYPLPQPDDHLKEEWQLLINNSLQKGIKIHFTVATGSGSKNYSGTVASIDTEGAALLVATDKGTKKFLAAAILSIY